MQRKKGFIQAAGALGVIGLPAVVAAAGAAFLKDTAMADLTDADLKLQNETAISVLEDPASDASKEWNNPNSGSSGRSESLGNFKSDDGLHCRKLRLWTQAKGIESRFAFPVCKGEDGTWFIASGKKLSKVQ